MKGRVHRIGNGWPSPSRRWCTRIKVETIDYFAKPIPNAVHCVGYAADEQDRITSEDESRLIRYPLIEWGISESEALSYCYSKGYDWGGLYEIFKRVSCYCCPLQRMDELRKLRKHFPELWQMMLAMDSACPEHNRGFKDYETVHDLEERFRNEDCQMTMFTQIEAPPAVDNMHTGAIAEPVQRIASCTETLIETSGLI
jgi:3'-phosphoadenosine 5'-phosphosulfate sulfotransferase (PAPS reductase)/FAD synthetase